MGKFNSANFADRISSTSAAKKALVEKMKARPADDDPEVLRKQAERQAIAEARAKRAAEKDELRRLQLLKEAEEKAAREAAEAARKAARDARYAARKARVKGG